jgi:hypothetical protein
MKTIIAIAAILVSTQTFAFFDDQNTSGSFVNNGQADMFGDAKGEGEATFGMTFEGTGSTNGALNGNTVGRVNADGNLIDDHSTNGQSRGAGSVTGFGDGRGDAKGSAKFSFNFSARAKGDADFRGGSDMNTNNGFHQVTTPYYYGAPAVK